jgi:cardiolipin synthase (CMP-forming)
LAGVLIAGFSDWLDGYIARRYNQQTVLGAFLDPAADKVVIGSLTLGLALKGLLPMPLAVLIVGRDVLILAMGFVQRAREKPKDAFFFDTTSSGNLSTHSSNEIVPT